MPQLDFFMYENVVVYSTIIFFILSYNFYLLLINIFKILKTRMLLNQVYDNLAIEINTSTSLERSANKFNLLAKELSNNAKING